MKLTISHTTKYTYDAPVMYGLQQLRLTPVSDRHQTVINWSLNVEGGHVELTYPDQYHNMTSLVHVDQGATEVVINVHGEVETHTSDGIYGKSYGSAPLWSFVQPTARTTAGPIIQSLSSLIKNPSGDLEELHALSAEILRRAPYQTYTTNVATTAEEAMAMQSGVCQDHAQIFIAAVRYAGLPARYVSGYLLMDDRIAQDASHAWAEVHIDDLGWVGFDVSNGISPDERYVRLATGRDSKDAAHISGLRTGNAHETMSVSLQIQQQ